MNTTEQTFVTEQIHTVEKKLRGEFNDHLKQVLASTQQVVDGMRDSFQTSLEETARNARAEATAEQVKVKGQALFFGLFEDGAAKFLEAVDDPTTSAADLQKQLYAAADAAVGGLSHGTPVPYIHITKRKLLGGCITAALGGWVARAVVQRVANAYLQAKQAESLEQPEV